MRYFGEVEGEAVQFVWTSHIDNAEFDRLFPGVKGKRLDSFSKRVGYLDSSSKKPLPLLRTIEFKNHPSLHKCDARCLNAKGHQCECSCGGKNHGAGG